VKTRRAKKPRPGRSLSPLSTADEDLLYDQGQIDPVWWIQEVLGSKPWEIQARIVEAVRDHKETAVASCHASGKSWIAARCGLWYLQTHPYSIIATTAPTFRQVRNIIWQEIRRAFKSSRYPLKGELLQTELRIDDGWFAFGFATDDPDKFQGLHSVEGHVLVIVDEAAGVSPEIWTAIDGILTSKDSRLLAIGNPTGTETFYQMFKRPGVAKIHISAFDTPNVQAGQTVVPGLVTRDWVEDKQQKWGLESPLYVSRVLGQFPESSTDALIRLSWIEAAQRRELPPAEPYILGVDVARQGQDESVIVLRRGPVARIHVATHQEDTMQTAGRIVRVLAETRAAEARIDAVGLGAGVYDRLAEQCLPVVEMQSGQAPLDSERFLNARAEWYWGLRERFEQGDIDLDEDEELAAQLANLKFKFTSRGQIQIESKEDMKKRGLRSPDRADALMLAFASLDSFEKIIISEHPITGDAGYTGMF
jgi:phage terminase large subunit